MNITIPLDDQTKALLERLDELWKFADQQMNQATFQTGGDIREVVLLSLTATSQRTVRSILSQIKCGSIDGLENHIRSLVKGIINVKYIWRMKHRIERELTLLTITSIGEEL